MNCSRNCSLNKIYSLLCSALLSKNPKTSSIPITYIIPPKTQPLYTSAPKEYANSLLSQCPIYQNLLKPLRNLFSLKNLSHKRISCKKLLVKNLKHKNLPNSLLNSLNKNFHSTIITKPNNLTNKSFLTLKINLWTLMKTRMIWSRMKIIPLTTIIMKTMKTMKNRKMQNTNKMKRPILLKLICKPRSSKIYSN